MDLYASIHAFTYFIHLLCVNNSYVFLGPTCIQYLLKHKLAIHPPRSCRHLHLRYNPYICLYTYICTKE